MGKIEGSLYSPHRGPPFRIVIERDSAHAQALSIVAVAALALLVYLGSTRLAGGLGFPLDDSWIHQTYARNLALFGQWAYQPGQVSAGSTSPVWTLVLSMGYWLGLDFRLWAYVLGYLTLVATAWGLFRLGRHLFPAQPAVAFLAALLAAGEWHLVWAAASGMETLLFTALSLILLDMASGPHPPTPSAAAAGEGERALHLSLLPKLREKGVGGMRALLSPSGIGLLGGLLVLTRPEGVVLLALVGLAWMMRHPRPASLAALGLGFALLTIPYLLFNHANGAGWLPNTFYAKQQEYAVLLAEPYLLRLARLITTTWVGPQVLLVPGLVCVAWRDRRSAWLPLLWWGAFLALYAWRLPVTYQHGRYLIPSIPILLLYGVAGTAALIRPNSPHRWTRLIGRTVVGALAMTAVVFVARGAWAYTVDVQIVNSEMVAAGRWLRDHTPPDVLIAAHDIGAIGYYAGRPLLDLAGLVTPEVIPMLRDEARLRAFMEAQRAGYLVTFPDWYPQLSADPCFIPVYQSDAHWSPAAGGEHMVVYRTCWR